jgi:uncharacterized membrane protein
MKLFAQMFLSLIASAVFSGGSLLHAATPIELIDHLGVAIPDTRFGVLGSSGLTISPHQCVGPELMLTEPTLLTKIGGFVNNRQQIINGVPLSPSTRPLTVLIQPDDIHGFPDPAIVLGELSFSHEHETKIECGDTSATLTGQTSHRESMLGSRPIKSAQCYTFATIDFPRATGSTSVSKINDRGQMVGGYVDDDGSHGFLSANGLFATIDVPGSIDTAVLGINNRRQLVGAYTDIVNRRHGFLWDRGGLTSIDVPGSTGTLVRGINNHGQMVGNYFDANGRSHGFLLNHGVFTTIDAPASSETTLSGINNHGQMVGFAGHGFLWDHGVFTTIQAPGALSTTAFDINDHGQIVGFYDVGLGGRSGFVWSDGVFTTIDVPNASETGALGINNRRQIVGGYTDEEDRSHGFLATPGRNGRVR